MKPGKKDVKTEILIQGDELTAIQNVSYLFTECFGLDSRIAKYKGKRPIGFYQWDFECLIAGIDYAIHDKNSHRWLSENEEVALVNLLEKVNEIYKNAYE